MAAVTQFIPTFLGGVSKQTDIKKQPGQVNEIINGYPDPTYGLLKRSGSQFLGTLATYVDDPTDDLKDGFWFPISRDNDERYLGVITKSGNIRIWNTVPQNTAGVLSFVEATITGKTNTDVQNYITPPANTDLHTVFQTFTYLDQTYLINKTKTVAMAAKANYYLRTRATVILGSIDYEQTYNVWIDGTNCSFTTIDLAAAEARGSAVDSEEILAGLKTAIETAVGTNYNVYKYSNSLEIERKDGQTPFTIEVKGGVQGVSLTAYQDEVSTSSRLAAYTRPGRRVKVVNAIDERASYYVKFASSGNLPGGSSTVNAGSGYWEEARGWDIDTDANGDPIATGGKYIAQLASTGFTTSTMPFKIRSTATNAFTIEAESWAPRLTGNDYGNPVPSFVGKQIKFGLIYGNRLVLLTNDTVSMSVARDFENFFFTSAQTVLASDPVDVETSSVTISNLYCAVPQAQGLVLFSEYEQYLLYSESGVISPSDVILRTISQYESDKTIVAKDAGDFITFVSKTPAYSRILGMQPRGNLQAAQVTDISKIVATYLPTDLEELVVNSQESLLAMFSPSKNSIYFYKYFNGGENQTMQSWFRWVIPGKLQTMVVINNYLLVLVRDANQYRVLLVDFVQSTSTNSLASFNNVRLDHNYIVKSAGTITYNSTTKKSTIPKPYNHISGNTPVLLTIPQVTAGSSTNYSNLFVETGSSTVTTDYIISVEIDNSGNWLVEGDWTGKEYELVAGYKFNFDVELPRYFFRSQNTVDWTSSLTIARMKFDVGFSGSVNFYMTKYGSPAWTYIAGVQYANYYLANNSPTIDRTSLTVPIHQKNTNYTLKINSDTPFPVSLNSMTWEGNYAPRYYRRAG